MTDKTFPEALRECIATVAGSEAFVSLYSDEMANFEKDPWPAIELAIAILMDKPICLALLPGREPPVKLRKIADHIVRGDSPEALAEGLKSWLSRELPRP